MAGAYRYVATADQDVAATYRLCKTADEEISIYIEGIVPEPGSRLKCVRTVYVGANPPGRKARPSVAHAGCGAGA